MGEGGMALILLYSVPCCIWGVQVHDAFSYLKVSLYICAWRIDYIHRIYRKSNVNAMIV